MKGARRLGRIEVRADDPSLTAHGGLVVIGDLAEKLDLIARIDDARVVIDLRTIDPADDARVAGALAALFATN